MGLSVESSSELKELFPPNSIIVSYRRPKNLKEILAPKRRNRPLPADAQATDCFKHDKTRCNL